MNMMTAGSAAASSFDDADLGDEYQRIGDVAKTFGVTLRTLRFYEDKGLLTPKREGTSRLYSKQDLARLRLIMLGRKVGFTLRDVKSMIDLYDPKGSNTRQLRVSLEKSNKQMVRLEQQRVELDEAISDLADLIQSLTKSLAEATQKG